jgi:myosin heavy subunit
MNETTQEMNETTQEMNETTQRMEQKTTEMSEDTEEVRQATGEMLRETTEMSETTKQMQQSTEQMVETTSGMAETTEGMAETMTTMAETTSGMAETMTEMASTTTGMAETMTNMAATHETMAEEMETMSAATADLQQTSNDLREATINLYDDNRQGAALELRSNARQFMKATDDQLAKLGYAGQYYMAFEYQLWKGAYSDDAAKLAALKHDAVEELIRAVYEFLPRRRSVSPRSTSASMKNLYALVAALHAVNSNGVLRATVTSDEPLGASAEAADAPAGVTSMLQLLEDGLAAKADLESGAILPENLAPHQKSVLEHEGVVIYMLQLRANFLTAMVAQTLATSDGERLGFFGRVHHVLFRWTAKTATRNLVELNMYLELLEEAQAAQDFLASIGAKAPLDGTLKRFLKKMRLDEAELQSAVPARAETVRALAEAVARLSL